MVYTLFLFVLLPLIAKSHLLNLRFPSRLLLQDAETRGAVDVGGDEEGEQVELIAEEEYTEVGGVVDGFVEREGENIQEAVEELNADWHLLVARIAIFAVVMLKLSECIASNRDVLFAYWKEGNNAIMAIFFFLILAVHECTRRALSEISSRG